MGDDCLLFCVDTIPDLVPDLPRFTARIRVIRETISDFDTDCNPIHVLCNLVNARGPGSDGAGSRDNDFVFRIAR
jgi:hypothetical protein